jgi:acetolactate synthase I/II/III large subunit
MPYFRISKAEEVTEVLQKALAVSGPALVEVDMNAIGPFPPYAPFNTMGKHAERTAR